MGKKLAKFFMYGRSMTQCVMLGWLQDVALESSGTLGLLRQLQATWHLRSGEVHGLELLEVIGRGGSATVLKGGSQPA